jgi:hypothetical protein
MTNALGAGTANITYNGPEEEAQILGKLAFDLDVTRGELLRRAVVVGLRQMHATAAAQIEAVREERLRMKSGLTCLAVGLIAISCAFLGNTEMRRPRRGRRIETEEISA